MNQQQLLMLAFIAFVLYLAATGRLKKLATAIKEPTTLSKIPGGPAGIRTYNTTTHTFQ